jgi:Niemann-Pick C1 protein
MLCIGFLVFLVAGLLPAMEIKINPISIANIIVTLSAAVEYSSYVSSILYECEKTTPPADDLQSRCATRLAPICLCLTSSTLCSIISLIILAFSKSPLVYVYFFRMYLALNILVFAVIVILFPVIWIMWKVRKK